MLYLLGGLVVSIFLVLRHFTWRAEEWPREALRPPVYQGHRGYWLGGAQENTLESFKQAARRGLQMIELDVRLSRDQVVVVFHDENLKRLAHSAARVSELTASDLKAQAQVCTLQEVLQSSEVPRFLNIELKTDKIWNDALEKAVSQVIHDHQAQGRVLFSSFNPLSLARLSRLQPTVPRALLATQEKEPGNRFYLRHLWLAPYIRIHALHLDHRFVSGQDMKMWRKRNIPVALWTVNDSGRAEEFLAQGALSIISDTLGATR